MKRKLLLVWMVVALVAGTVLTLFSTLVFVGIVISPNFHWKWSHESAFAWSQVATIGLGFFWIVEFNRVRKKLKQSKGIVG